MLSWMGLDSQTAPRPPRLPRNFRFFRRGWLLGVGMGGGAVAVFTWLALHSAPYCGGW